MVPQPHMAPPVPTSTSYTTQLAYIPLTRYNPYYLNPCPPGMTPMPHMGVNFFQPSIQQQTQQFEQLNIANPLNPQNQGRRRERTNNLNNMGRGETKFLNRT